MIKWGIIGLGKIALRFIEGLSYCKEGQLYAGASYTKEKRDFFHHQHPQALVYTTYDELLNDEQIDAVYIAVPHGLHYEWAQKALLKKKAVLCEKPATLTYQHTYELCELSRQHHVFFMEAMKTRFIPLIDDLKQMLKEGIIGDIVKIETSFCSDVAYNQKSYLFDAQQGGALYDVAIYNIATILDYIHAPIQDVQVHMERKYHVDVYDYVEVTFETGQKAIIEVAIDRMKDKTMIITGTKGIIRATPFYRPMEMIVEKEGLQQIYRKSYVYHNDFYGEIHEVHECLQQHCYESARMSHQDSLKCMALIEKIKESFHD